MGSKVLSGFSGYREVLMKPPGLKNNEVKVV